jgi:IS5 family transposase
MGRESLLAVLTGETYLQIESPIDPSSLTRWRKRIGEEGVETMLMATIKAGRKLGLLKAASTGNPPNFHRGEK